MPLIPPHFLCTKSFPSPRGVPFPWPQGLWKVVSSTGSLSSDSQKLLFAFESSAQMVSLRERTPITQTKSSSPFCALPPLDSVRCEHHSWCLNIQQYDSLAHMDKPTLPPEGVIFKVGYIRWSREWWEGKVRTDLYLHFTLIFISTDLYKGVFF